MRPRLGLTLLVATLLIGLVTGCASSSTSTTTSTTIAPTTSSTTAPGPPRQPAQPTSGLGGSAYAHRDWRVSSGGTGPDAWYAFEPVGPRPRTAPLAIVLHGYYEYEGYASMEAFIRHTVRSGSVVIYPRWQTDKVVPCPGPFDVEPCVASANKGIHDALAFLQADPGRVQPDVDAASYFGFSFGGIVTANLANRWRSLDLPRPRAIFLDDPHDSGLDGPGEPAFDDSMAGIPSTTYVECHVGAEGILAEDPTGGCNALFPLLGHIPASRKAIVLTHPDDHGTPALSSKHGVCAARAGEADAYDWNFCWKVWDALRAAAAGDPLSPAAISGSAAHRDNGSWSDGTPIAPLVVRHEAPIAP